MAIVKATYTKKQAGAKASISYIAHRPGREGEKSNRVLFGSDGVMGRREAYQMIDLAAKGSFFYRIVIAPDPAQEDSQKDLHLRDITEKTMQTLAESFITPLLWVAAEHTDHAPHRHIHVVAIVPEKLVVPDFQELRKSATEACLQQRQERDLMQEQQQNQSREEAQAQWE